MTHATSPPRKATGPPPMSLILRWQESKSESRAWGGGGRPTMPAVVAERSITHWRPHAHDTTLPGRQCATNNSCERRRRTEHRSTRARESGSLGTALPAAALRRPPLVYTPPAPPVVLQPPHSYLCDVTLKQFYWFLNIIPRRRYKCLICNTAKQVEFRGFDTVE